MDALFLLVCHATLTLAVQDWGYGGNHAPANWGAVSAACSGSQQSPVAVVTADVTEDLALGSLTFTGYDAPPTGMVLSNNGHTLTLSVTGTPSISGGGLNGTYRVHNVHLHWGSDDGQGSEHTIDGTQYAAELHVVHYLASAGSLTAALNMTSGVAVLGFMITAGGSTHAGLQKILDLAPNVTYKGWTETLTPFALEDLLTADRSRFFRYPGSLTTPPCTQGLVWTLFASPIQVSSAQLVALRGLRENDDNGTESELSDNFRPTQPLNGRIVKANFKQDKGPTGCAVGGHVPTVLTTLLLSLSCLISYFR